jgi:hypothetical protein
MNFEIKTVNHMNKILLILLIIFTGCGPNQKGNNTVEKAIYDDYVITPKKIIINDNVERHLFDYSISDEIGLNKMHAPVGWTEPIIKAKFEIRGIVLNGVLGLEFEEGVKKIPSSNGFLIPNNTKVRIFNAGSEELVLIEVLRPGYQKELVRFFEGFNN